MPKKVDQIHDAILRDDPTVPDATAWAIAWSKYKKENTVTERLEVLKQEVYKK